MNGYGMSLRENITIVNHGCIIQPMKTKIIVVCTLMATFSLPLVTHAAVKTVDFNNDTCFDQNDLNAFSGQLGSTTSALDIDSSGKVDLKDTAYLMKNWEACTNTVNYQKLYPYAVGKQLKWKGYNEDGSDASTYEISSIEPWQDGKHFTIHRQYGNVGEAAPWCPRVDDTFYWTGDNTSLYYQETYNFYNEGKPESLTRTYLQDGQLWGTSYAQKDVVYPGSSGGIVYDIQHADCFVTNMTYKGNNGYAYNKRSVGVSSAWSPYTGGSSHPVGTLQVNISNDLATIPAVTDAFQEEWHFYKDPQLGYIPIRAVIRTKDAFGTVRVVSDERLESIQ